jgi:hypothetical protein
MGIGKWIIDDLKRCNKQYDEENPERPPLFDRRERSSSDDDDDDYEMPSRGIHGHTRGPRRAET